MALPSSGTIIHEKNGWRRTNGGSVISGQSASLAPDCQTQAPRLSKSLRIEIRVAQKFRIADLFGWRRYADELPRLFLSIGICLNGLGSRIRLIGIVAGRGCHPQSDAGVIGKLEIIDENGKLEQAFSQFTRRG